MRGDGSVGVGSNGTKNVDGSNENLEKLGRVGLLERGTRVGNDDSDGRRWVGGGSMYGSGGMSDANGDNSTPSDD